MSAPALPSVASAPWLHRSDTQAVFRAIAAGGFEVRAVGGAVRDMLLRRRVRDVDLATTAPPQTVIQLAERAKLKALPTGIEHGTVTVIAEGHPFQVTTLRRDVETYGRHAKVAFTADWAEDAGRRDFTMNALYADASGVVFDPLGGLDDLETGRIRFIGNAAARIAEDHLRILRYFRFQSELGRTPLDAEGVLACVRGREGLRALSSERVKEEFFRLLAGPRAEEVVCSMFDHGLLVDVIGVAPRFGPFTRLVAIEAGLGEAPDPLLRLAALAVEVEEDAKFLSNRLRLSGREHDGLLVAARAERRIAPPTADEAKRLLYRHGVEGFRTTILISWARSEGRSDDSWRAAHGLPVSWTAPKFPLHGDDLIALGIKPGPRLGAVLRRLEAAWTEEGFTPGRDDLLDRAQIVAKEDR